MRLFVPRYSPAAQVRILPATEKRPRLGPTGTTLRQVKNTGDYDVAVRFNRHGLRDSKDLRDATENDLYVVGDSFGIGWGVEEEARFSNRLQVHLGVPVFNISTPGSNLLDYEQLVGYAEEQGAEVRRLVVAFCMENDLGPYPPPGVTRRYRPNGRSGLRETLAKNSAVYALVTHTVHSSPPLRKVAIRAGLITPNLAAIPQHRYSREILEATRDRLLGLQRSEMVVLIIPSRGLWTGGREIETARIHEAFVALLRDAGLHVVDMRSDMELGRAPLRYHFRQDGHWNVAGHELAAASLTQALGSRAAESPE